MADHAAKAELEAAYQSESEVGGIPALRETLRRYDNSFVSSRYVFEKRDTPDLDIGSLVELVRFMGKRVHGLTVRNYATA